MPGFTESNITLNFPDNNFFRFANCPGYRSLSGYSFKEMDACWYDESCNELWLFELKDFSFASLDSRTIKEKSWELINKAVDSLAMLLSLKHHYTFVKDLYKIKHRGYFGFMNRLGEVVIKPQYLEVGHFASGYTSVAFNGQRLLLDEQGQLSVKRLYRFVGTFSERAPTTATTATTCSCCRFCCWLCCCFCFWYYYCYCY